MLMVQLRRVFLLPSSVYARLLIPKGCPHTKRSYNMCDWKVQNKRFLDTQADNVYLFSDILSGIAFYPN